MDFTYLLMHKHNRFNGHFLSEPWFDSCLLDSCRESVDVCDSTHAHTTQQCVQRILNKFSASFSSLSWLPNKVINEIDHGGMVWFWQRLDQRQKVLLFSLRVRQTYNRQTSRLTIIITKQTTNRNYFTVTPEVGMHRIQFPQIWPKPDFCWHIWPEPDVKNRHFRAHHSTS